MEYLLNDNLSNSNIVEIKKVTYKILSVIQISYTESKVIYMTHLFCSIHVFANKSRKNLQLFLLRISALHNFMALLSYKMFREREN